MNKKIHKIVLSGGPCAGKSTALSVLRDKLTSLGYKVFCVPEAATTLVLAGMEFVNGNPEASIYTQDAILQMQLSNETIFEELASRQQEPVVILFDRGTMDAKAFVSKDTWEACLARSSKSEAELSNRYDAVIHLTSVAVDKPYLYQLENNPARNETAQEAAQVDERIKQAWLSNPHLRVINNETDFEGKIQKVMSAIYRVIGHPEPLEIERKYLVKWVDWVHRDRNMDESHITQKYLPDGSRIRKRTRNGYSTYTYTRKGPLQSSGKRAEYEERISGAAYVIFS